MKISEKQLLALISIAQTCLHTDAFNKEGSQEVRALLNQIVDQQSEKLKEVE